MGRKELKELNPNHLLIAHLIAERHTSDVIASKVGLSRSYVVKLARDPSMVLKVKEISDEIESARIQNSVDLHAYFNHIAKDAAEEEYSLAINAEKEAVRLNACKDILDRASEAPKATKFEPVTNDRRLIQLGVGMVEGMKEALQESGRKDVVDMFEREEGDWGVEEDVGELGEVRELPIKKSPIKVIEV